MRNQANLFVFPVLVTLATVWSASAQPTFVKAFTPSTIGSGNVSTLKFDITNADVTPVSDLAFTDVLPAGMVIATPADAVTDCTSAVLSAPAAGGTITLSGGRVDSTSACFVSVDVTSSTVGINANTSGDLTSDAGNSGQAMANLTIDASRPGFSKSFAPNPIPVGGTSTLTFTITNTATGIIPFAIFADTLPDGLVVAVVPAASTDCGGTITASPGSSTIAVTSGFILGMTSCIVKVDVTAQTAGSKENTTGDLTYGSSILSAGKAGSVLEVERGFLTKIFPDDPVPPGGNVTLEFTVTNFDRVDSATDITFSDDLGAALSGLTAIGLPLTDPCGMSSQLAGTSLLTLTGGNLGPEGSCTFSTTLLIPGGAMPGVYPNTTSSVTSMIGGNPVVNVPATDKLIVSTVPLLTKSFIDDPVTAGDMVTLRFTVTNSSSTASATAITFDDVLFDGLPSAATIPVNPCGVGSTAIFFPPVPDGAAATIRLSGGVLGQGESCEFDFVLNMEPSLTTGNYVNTSGFISATVDGKTLFGLPATDTLQVVAAPRLTKVFTDDPVLPGGTVTLEFTLDVAPEAPGEATSIAFMDDLDATLSGLIAVGLPKNDICGTGSQLSGTSVVSFAGGTVSIGSSCTFSATLQVPSGIPPGSHTNTTSEVTATSLTLSVASNAAADDLQIGGVSFSKAFTDDPVLAGEMVTLEFTIDNLSSTTTASNLLFIDNLNGSLTGLSATDLPLNDICGTGSQLSGTTSLIFTGGSLAPNTSCTFTTVLQVPVAASVNDYSNVTSSLFFDFSGSSVSVGPASDVLSVIAPLSLGKTFLDDPVLPGNTVTLEFTILNSSTNSLTSIGFMDDLDAALTGLAAVGLPANNICGTGSQLSGTGLLTFSGGSLGPSSTCTFTVTLQVPAGVSLGTTATNTTSQVTGMLGVLATTGAPATDDLEIRAPVCLAKNGENVTLQNAIVLSAEIYEVCDTIEVGPNLQVSARSGSLTVLAGQRIVFMNGFSIGTGNVGTVSGLIAGTDSDLKAK